MDDATRRPDDVPGDPRSVSEALSELIGTLSHAVLEIVSRDAFPIAERLRVEGEDPFVVIELVAETLRALADGLAQPAEDFWTTG